MKRITQLAIDILAILILITAGRDIWNYMIADNQGHWNCENERYETNPEKCYTNSCNEDYDCKIEFYDTACGKIEGVFPRGAVPPKFEPKRCLFGTCSIIMAGCVEPKVGVLRAKCQDGKCIAVEKKGKEIFMKGKQFYVGVAETELERAKGLMGVTHLAKNEGMMFIFDKPGKYAFWMKNTLIPLDIIFLDKDFKVITIHTASPCESDPCNTYGPKEDALYVVELNAGVANEIGLKEGDLVEIKQKV